MRILDETGAEVLSPDLTKGYLVEDSLFIMHHEAIPEVEEQGHYKTVAEYPNGGKDVEWIIDVPWSEATDAWDEYEKIQRYVLYTQEELNMIRIDELKGLLQSTDYKILQLAEGQISEEQCTDIIKKRSNWRAEINDLENKSK